LAPEPATTWARGNYARMAWRLRPAAARVVEAADVASGDAVLDVACGTGNAALVAHDAGAVVTGLDASPRLLRVARERVPSGEFVRGDAARLPFDDGQFDAAVSIFGTIFARPAEQVAGEIARVVRPGGRVAITTWPARGPMFEAVSLMRRALGRSRPPDDAPTPVDQGDPAVLEALFGHYGDIEVGEHELTHATTTPEAFWERWERLHPIWIGARRQLEPAGEWEPLRDAVIAVLREGGMGSGATSPYLLAVLDRR
jgi:SAM-dependent methyltransferase